MSCAICETRVEKRFCLAVHGRICAPCCGREREVTLDCPSQCPWLQQARRNERPRPFQDIPREELLPEIEIAQQTLVAREPLLIGISYAIARAARADRALRDRDAIAGLAALARRYQTRANSGLIVDVATPNVAEQAVIAEIEKILSEYRQVEERHTGYATLRDSEIVQALVFLLRTAHSRTSGRP